MRLMLEVMWVYLKKDWQMLTQQIKVWMCHYPLGRSSYVLCSLVKPSKWQDPPK